MEQQTISITKAGIQANLNARTSILAAANPKHGRYDRTKTLKANVDMTAPIMSRFDLFFVVVDDCDEMVDRSVAAHIVDSHRGLRRALEAPFTLHQLQTYVRAARRQQPSISDAARRRLVSCYRALRQNDVVGRGKTAYRITVRQLESMVRLAEAHARLHFQTQVQVANVVEAFRLLKKSIISVETEGVMLEEEDEEEEAYLEDEAADQDQEEAKNDEEEVATRPAKVARVEDVPARPPAVAVAATPPEVKGEEAGRPDGETPPMPKAAAAAKKKKREKIRLSYEDFKRYEHDLTTRLRKRDGGIKRTELIALYLQAHYDSIGDDVDKIAEHTRLIKQIIKRLLKDEAIIVVPSEEDDESAADEVILAIHPNYTPLDDAM